jgi:hypothetical protein
MTLSVKTILLAGMLSFCAFPLPTPNPITACAVAPPRNGQVSIFDESAIIVWDATTKTEHFIRRASFQTAVKEFGFIVPTPTKPTLGESDNKAFSELARITAPKIVTKPRQISSGGCGCSADKAMFAGRASPGNAVHVLEETQVAGYDAAVLEADDADALSKWLTDHGYEFSPELKDWAGIYIKMGWKLTAFKIAKSADDKPAVSTSAVKMTFQTDRPFYPYREPLKPTATNSAATTRVLRVYFLGDKIVDGHIGTGTSNWPASVPWCNEVGTADCEKVRQMLKLPEPAPSASWRLTEFEDRSSPRPAADDVYYGTSESQVPRERPPEIHYVSNNLPGALMFAAVGLYLAAPGLLRRIRK